MNPYNKEKELKINVYQTVDAGGDKRFGFQVEGSEEKPDLCLDINGLANCVRTILGHYYDDGHFVNATLISLAPRHDIQVVKHYDGNVFRLCSPLNESDRDEFWKKLIS